MPTIRRIALLAVLLAAAAAAGAAAASRAAEPRPEPGQPVAKELAAAAERWKIERAAERAQTPGAAGQHDLFWEILRLWEKDEKARADADLAAVADWLLFTAGLWMDPNLADPVYGKVPALVPKLGEKLMDKRLSAWIGAVQTTSGGGEPWLWPDFPGMDKKALAAGVGRLMKTGPKNNPVARVWMAAALVAAGDDGGLEELAAARATVEKELPSRAAGLTAALVQSLSAAGVKACLPLLLDQAEAELTAAARPAVAPVPAYYERTVPWTFSRFCQLVGWSSRRLTSGQADAKAEVEKARGWLKDNLAKLAWDAKLRRFTGGGPQPGMEKLQAAAQAVEKKWNLAVLDRLAAGQISHSLAIHEITVLVESKAEAAKDPAVGDLIVALVEDGGPGVTGYLERDPLRARLTKASPELGARYLGAAIRGMLLSGNQVYLESFMRDPTAFDPKVTAPIFAQLAPEFEKAFAEAAKAGDPAKMLSAAAACLFVGGKIEKKALAELVAKSPTSAYGYSRESLLGQRAFSLIRAGRPGGLRLMLELGRKELGKYAAEGAMHPLRQFGYYAGWRDQSEPPPGTAEEELAKADAWLDKYEAALKWDAQRGRFTGAPPPGLEAAAAAAEAVKARWGLKADEALAGGQDAARRLLSEAVELMEQKPEAAKDAELAALLLALVESGRLDSSAFADEVIRERLCVKLPKLNRAVGVKVWSAYLRRLLVSSSTPYELYNIPTRFKGVDLGVVAEAARALQPEVKKALEAAAGGRFDERVGRTMAYLYAGGEVSREDLDKLLAEADKLGSTGLARIGQWAQPIAEAGNPTGLRLVLLNAKANRSSRANSLGQFEYLAGKSNDRFGNELFRLGDEALLARVEAALKWLEDNQKNLEFDGEKGRFRLKGGAPAPAPDPRKKPPEEVF